MVTRLWIRPGQLFAWGLVKSSLTTGVAAVSVGIVDGKAFLDLDYELDFAADVDMNVVMTGRGRFVEIQGTGEEATFSQTELDSLLTAGKKGIKSLTAIQQKALGKRWELVG